MLESRERRGENKLFSDESNEADPGLRKLLAPAERPTHTLVRRQIKSEISGNNKRFVVK